MLAVLNAHIVHLVKHVPCARVTSMGPRHSWRISLFVLRADVTAQNSCRDSQTAEYIVGIVTRQSRDHGQLGISDCPSRSTLSIRSRLRALAWSRHRARRHLVRSACWDRPMWAELEIAARHKSACVSWSRRAGYRGCSSKPGGIADIDLMPLFGTCIHMNQYIIHTQSIHIFYRCLLAIGDIDRYMVDTSSIHHRYMWRRYIN
jgi:hypothetical protein